MTIDQALNEAETHLRKCPFVTGGDIDTVFKKLREALSAPGDEYENSDAAGEMQIACQVATFNNSTLDTKPPDARYRHLKKGSTYRMVREDRVKIESDWVDAVVYESADGLWIVRAKAEFFDGRFEKIEEAK